MGASFRTGIVCGDGRLRPLGTIFILPAPKEPRVPLCEADNELFFSDLLPGMRIAFTLVTVGGEIRARCSRVLDPRSTSKWSRVVVDRSSEQEQEGERLSCSCHSISCGCRATDSSA